MTKDNDNGLLSFLEDYFDVRLRDPYERARMLLEEVVTSLSEKTMTEDEAAPKIKEAASEIDKVLIQIEDEGKLDELQVDFYRQTGVYKYAYGLAGEIYARIDKSRSLDFFKKYQFYGSQFKSEFEENKDLGVVVYSFRGCNEYLFEDLINKTITLVKPKLMNDPFDSLIISWKENLNNIDCKDKAHLECLSESLDYFRIRSFCSNLKTKKKDNSIVRNILMWSHYAEEHKGICIQYRLKDKFIKSANIENRSTLFLKGIDYGSNKAGVVDINNSKINANTAFFRKCNVWKYEREVRLISYNISTEENYIKEPINDDAKIEAIYFGCKCTNEYKKIITSILERQNILFYEMKPDLKNIYKLKIKRYNDSELRKSL